jgi:hypothetical protein
MVLGIASHRSWHFPLAVQDDISEFRVRLLLYILAIQPGDLQFPKLIGDRVAMPGAAMAVDATVVIQLLARIRCKYWRGKRQGSGKGKAPYVDEFQFVVLSSARVGEWLQNSTLLRDIKQSN